MPRLIKAERGNGFRPSDPRYVADESRTDDERRLLPVLDVSDETHERVGELHDAARDDENDAAWPILGQVLLIDNPRPIMPAGAKQRRGAMEFRAALSTIHEAATEVIGAFEDQALDMPTWVASTAPELAEVIAEHFTIAGYNDCEVIDMDDASERYGETVA